MNAIIVWYYNYNAERDEYKVIANNEVLCSGDIEIRGCSRENNKVSIGATCCTEGSTQMVGGLYDYFYNEYWAPNHIREELISKLVKELFPDYHINIVNIINMN